MACTLLLEFRTKPEFTDGMAKMFKDLFPDTRSFDGCISIYGSQNQDDKHSFALVEVWESREKYEAYLEWRTERGDLENLASMLESDPSFRFFDMIGA